FSDTVYAFRTPGYPVFVAACRANIRAVRAAQAVLDTLSVLGIFLLASQLCAAEQRRWLPPTAGLIVAINPYLVYFTGLILSETLFAAMLVWGMVLLVRGKGGQGRSWSSIGVWLCGAC